MKKILFSLFVSASTAFTLNAKILTVSNNTNSPGQYSDLQTACDAASANDTIYVHASEKDYGNINIRKKLVLIGEGTLPNQQIRLMTYVGQITFTHATESTSSATSSGSKVYGINSTFAIGTNKDGYGLGGFTLERCKGNIQVQGLINTSNIIINQFVGSITFSLRLTNSIISNSILSSIAWGEGDYGSVNKSSNNIVRNCIIGNNCSVYGAVVTNNIFYEPTLEPNINTKNSTYNNNLFYFKSIPILVNATTTATGNVFNQDPMFVNPESLASNVVQYSYTTQGNFANFNLKPVSPALTMGTDGTQIGIYGGPTPWIDGGEGIFRYGTMPSQVPYVTDMDILNTAIPENGTLNVKIKARTQQ
jgi:hypothetical protein